MYLAPVYWWVCFRFHISLLVPGLLVYGYYRYLIVSDEFEFEINEIRSSLLLLWVTLPIIIVIEGSWLSYFVFQTLISHYQIDMVVLVVGHQWYWTYEILDLNIDIYPGLLYGDSNLSIILPSNKLILIRFTSSDVIHRFGVPSLNIKVDCIPGKTSDRLATVNSIGYQAYCYEFCGVKHSLIPTLLVGIS